MTFKYICIGISVVVVIVSVVNSSRTEREHTTRDFMEIANNITSVQNLLQKVFKSFKDMEKRVTSDSIETDDKTDSENDENTEWNTNNKGKVYPKSTTRPKAFKGTPIYFSDRSLEKDDSETEEKERNDVPKINENTTNTAKALKKPSPPRQPIGFETNNKMKASSSEDETDSSGDVVSSNENLRINHENKVTPRKDIVKNFEINLAKAKRKLKSRATAVKEKYLSTTPKILEAAKDGHDSQSNEDTVIKNEVVRAGYLREAYVDACKQVVIRKCLRALRAVSKDVCSRSKKCSSEYKDDFKANGQAACDEQFNSSGACRMGVDLEEPAAKSLEIQGLRATTVKNKKKSKTSDIQEVKILRDRFEKICKQKSYEKCRVACKDASEKTCKVHECVKAKTKALKRSCKRRCQDSFHYSAGSDESDENDDDDSYSDDSDSSDDEKKDKDGDKDKYKDKDKDKDKND